MGKDQKTARGLAAYSRVIGSTGKETQNESQNETSERDSKGPLQVKGPVPTAKVKPISTPAKDVPQRTKPLPGNDGGEVQTNKAGPSVSSRFSQERPSFPSVRQTDAPSDKQFKSSSDKQFKSTEIPSHRASKPSGFYPDQTAQIPPSGLIKATETKGDSKYRKVAKLLVIIGQDQGAKILAKLDSDQVEAIARELTTIRSVSDQEARVIIAEFRELFSSSLAPGGSSEGGIETARRLLHTAFGEEQGEAFLRRAVPEARENPFAFLEDFTGEQIAFLLKEEQASTAALVLSRLSPKIAAETLKIFDEKRRLETLKRLAKMGKTVPEVLERVAAALRERAHAIGQVKATEIDGRAALAAILRQVDPSFGDRILEELEETDGDLGRELKEKLYTFDDVLSVDDRPLAAHLRGMADRDIAILLKGRSPEFIKKIKANLSSTRRAMVEEEEELLGPLPRREVEQVGRDFMAWFRLGREQGRIILLNDEDVLS